MAAEREDDELPNFSLMFNFSVSEDENIVSESTETNGNNDIEGSTNKRRFAAVGTKGLDDLVENAQAKKTKKQHNGQFPFSQVGINNMNILSFNI